MFSLSSSPSLWPITTFEGYFLKTFKLSENVQQVVGNPELERGARTGSPCFRCSGVQLWSCTASVRAPWGAQVEKWPAHLGLPWWPGLRWGLQSLQASRRLSCTFSLQLQGAIMVASCVQMVVGFSGLIGFLMRFIGPLTIAPTISLVALPLFDSAGNNAGIHWGIATM